MCEFLFKYWVNIPFTALFTHWPISFVHTTLIQKQNCVNASPVPLFMLFKDSLFWNFTIMALQSIASRVKGSFRVIDINHTTEGVKMGFGQTLNNISWDRFLTITDWMVQFYQLIVSVASLDLRYPRFTGEQIESKTDSCSRWSSSTGAAALLYSLLDWSSCPVQQLLQSQSTTTRKVCWNYTVGADNCNQCRPCPVDTFQFSTDYIV